MDRNNLIGFILIFAILGGSFYLMKPSQEEIKKEQQLQDSIKRAKEGVVVTKDSTKITSAAQAVADSVLAKQPFGVATQGTEQTITLENERIAVTLSNKGGRVKSVELKGEKNYDDSKLILF